MRWSFLKPALLVSLGLWPLLGVAYPLAATAVSQLLFPRQAAGSLVRLRGRVVGAAHVGQNFWGQRDYFWGRPSATLSPLTGRLQPYDAENSGSSNLGPTSRTLLVDVQEALRQLQAASPGLRRRQIPLSLVEVSASGLDPDITVGAALIQVPRVAKNTGLSRNYLTALVRLAARSPEWGLFGTERVNVLTLNLLVYRSLHDTAHREPPT